MLSRRAVLDGRRAGLEFRAEAFNATNTPHFANPIEVIGARNTGREGIDERVFRFGLRLSF